MRSVTIQLALSIISFASLRIVGAALDVCSSIDPKAVDLNKWKLLNTEAFQKDEFTHEMWLGYYGGEFKAQIVGYPYGGGNVLTLRHRASATGYNFRSAFGRAAVGISVGGTINYFWLHSDTTCRGLSPKNANFGDVSTITIYSAN